MWRFTERMVRSMLVTACRLATSPTSTSPFLAKATTLGVVREPSEFAMTSGSPPDNTETTELVVPRSIPTARDMGITPFDVFNDRRHGASTHWSLSKELSRGRSSSAIGSDLRHGG